MITRDQIGDALRFIAETDEQLAEAKTEVERKVWICKHARALAYQATTGTVDERKAAVETNEDVVQYEMGRLDAFLAYEKLKAKRETQFLRIEVWRSLEATRRRETV